MNNFINVSFVVYFDKIFCINKIGYSTITVSFKSSIQLMTIVNCFVLLSFVFNAA